jgi:hypothetical protein
MRARIALALSLLLLTAAPAVAQVGFGPSLERYTGYYGDPIEVELEDVWSHGASYQKKMVRTKGMLDLFSGVTQGYYRLREGSAEVLLIPIGDVEFEIRSMIGREVEVVGVVRRIPEQQQYNQGCGLDSQCEDPILPPLPSRAGNMMLPEYSITAVSLTDITEFEKKVEQEAPLVSLEELVDNPGKHDNKVVRVVGKFRGRNLYGDLPLRSQTGSSDWVIKDDVYAVWITGRKPRGSGWALDPSLKRDTGKWVEVLGRPATRNGLTYVRAVKVALTTAPSKTADAAPAPPPPEKPKLPPVVVFALPLDGETEVPANARFAIQFSKDMDEASFKGRVVLRYVGLRRPGDRPLDGLRLSYDGGRKALFVDPGDVLRPGRQLELLLLPGIADVDGLTLEPRSGRQFEGAVDVLRFRVGL